MMDGDGSSVTSSRRIVMRACDAMRVVTPAANRSRSTASAVPPGTRAASAQVSTIEPSRRISALSNPCALCVSVLLNVFEHTSSASRSV